MSAAKRKTIWLLFVLLALFASSAIASIPKPDAPLQPIFTAERAELLDSAAVEPPPQRLIDRASFAWLDEVSHVSIDSQDEIRISDVAPFDEITPRSLFAVKQNLASGLSSCADETNVSCSSELGLETWWGVDFHAYPFVEPANGLVYARARWYDPSTGTFVTPDPQGYIDSSNMYAFCGGDPVNCSDPTGEAGLRDWWNRNIDSLDEEGWKEFRGLLSGSVGALPVAGEITDAVQAVTGHDFIAGEKLETWERGVAAASILVPFGGARVLRKATGEAIDALKASDDVVEKVVDATGGGAEDYLVSQRRIARYEAKLQQMVSSGTHRGEKLAELSGRVEMLKQGYLKEGHGIYEAQTRLITTASGKQVRRRVGGKGIDAVYSSYDDFLSSGFGTRAAYRTALQQGQASGSMAILESKWRKNFSVGSDPESLLGRGIKNLGRSGPAYFEQMSANWISEVRRRLLQSDVAGASSMGQLLARNRHARRFINVLNANGQSVIHRMP